ncbi:MAG: cyclic nucleotide-binding domain-containing protein, partial [Myxococcales bacterium]|nr:cyclic nucleotide-binding domain-containing protein [Myxococcales bacterium]
MTEVVADARPRGLPDAVFRAPVLRGLDDAARGRVSAAGRLRTIAPGAVAYREGERGDALAIVIRGSIALEATPRGSDAPRVLREAHAGESFGEEACLPGGVRQATARAISEVELVEIPVSVFRRGLGRDEADGEEGERRRDAGQAQLRLLRRAATADLLRTMVLTRDLDDDERGLVLDAVIHEHRARGERIYGVGERARELYMIASGLVQLQTEDADGRIQVRAYLSAGDFFGDEELTRGEPRKTHAFAVGDCQLLRLPGAALRTLADRNPKLLVGLRRIASQRGAHQQAIVGEASDRSTRHVFHDLYRMQMASSLLTIDQDTCVRCGHCAWSCAATHGGVARLVRRGDKVLTRLRVLDQGSEPRSLLLPNSCQHCKNPVCMIDCPTGAIGRDPEGEVFIREALCTGCGACAKACPWENIRMAPRPGDALGKLSSWLTAAQQARPSNDKPVAKDKPADYGELAVKCDLCRDYEAPACVQSCPTGSILRLDPERDFAEVAALLDPEKAAEARAREGGKAVGIALAWGLGGALLIGVIARFGAARL